MSCILCREVLGELGPVAFQDDLVVVFPARLQPARNQGCVLLATRTHVPNLYDVPDADLGPLLERVRNTARSVQQAADATGTTIRQNNGPPGQEINHLHFHIAPRFPGDDYWHAEAAAVSEKERERQAALLRPLLAEDQAPHEPRPARSE